MIASIDRELIEELPLQFIARDARFVGGDSGRRGPRLRRLAEVVGHNLGVAAVGVCCRRARSRTPAAGGQ